MVESSDINETTQDIIEEFSFFDDWMQRYEYIIEMGKALKGLPEHKKDEAHKVQGCQSQVWFYATQKGKKIKFDADSDAMIVRGLIALLLRVYSDRTPGEIINTPPEFFEVLDLGSHLSGSRANGLHAMVKRIHAYAKAYEHEQTSRSISPGKLS